MAGEVLHVIITVLRTYFAGEAIEPGMRGLHQHCAPRHVAAEQRALHTLQHLDGLKVEKAVAEAIGARLHDLGEIGADRRIGEELRLLRALASQREGDGVALALRAGDGQRRGTILQRLNVSDTHLLQSVPGERGNRNRHILDRFLTPASGDDDVRGRNRLLGLGRGIVGSLGCGRLCDLQQCAA